MKTSVLATCTMALASLSAAFPRASPEPETPAGPTTHALIARGCTSIWQCTVADANAIADALIARGTQEISVGNSWSVIYNQDDRCGLLGHALNTNSAASFSRDVGYGLRNIINSCSSNGKAGGDGTAGGNGYFGISLAGSAS